MVLLIKELRLYSKLYLTTLFAAIIISLGLNLSPLVNTFSQVIKPQNIEYNIKYDFLRALVASDDIILSDLNSNIIIPGINGKVISSEYALYWINDIKERRKAVNSFFHKENPDSVRQFVINKYHPDFLLIDYTKVQFEYSTLQWLRSIGQTVYKKDQLELIKIMVLP